MALAWKSMWKYKCPRCRKGDLYKTPMELSKPLAMHDNCSVCKQPYEPEPHFYQGAMFIGYGIAIWAYVLPGLFFVFVLKWSFNTAIAIMLLQFAVMILWILRFSRSMWLHFMVKYDPRTASLTED